jgi:hypothetical protein
MRRPTLYDRDLRRNLLGTASAVALLALSQTPEQARADDASGQHIWLDLTGQYSMTSGQGTVFGEPFDDDPLHGGVYPQVRVRGPGGGDGTISLTLQQDEWYFNLSFNYGRTGTSRDSFLRTFSTPHKFGTTEGFAAGSVRHSESHKLVDFTVGQDVGLGMFGMDGTSILSAGVRWANFDGTTIGDFAYASKYHHITGNNTFFYGPYAFHREMHSTFNGIGPMISWKGSAPFEGSDFSFEWGANAAILFGKHSVHGFNAPDFSRGATVTQVGGSLGFGWHCPDWLNYGPFLDLTIQVE